MVGNESAEAPPGLPEPAWDGVLELPVGSASVRGAVFCSARRRALESFLCCVVAIKLVPRTIPETSKRQIVSTVQEKNDEKVTSIGQRVKLLRERLGISQTELAERMGFSRNYISVVENGKKPAHRFVRALELLEEAPIPFSGQTATVREEGYSAGPRGRIKARRLHLRLSLEDLAKLTGYPKSTLRNVEDGLARAEERLLRQLAKHLDLPLDELIGGSDYPHLVDGGRTDRAEPNIATEPGLTAQVIPQLSWAQAGTSAAWDDVFEHEGFTAFNLKDKKAVALQIRGDSMEPQFPHGTIAIVYPTWEAKSGDLVIARLVDGTVMFKRLHVDGERYTFISLNPIYPPLTVEKSKIEKLLPVGGTYRNQL